MKQFFSDALTAHWWLTLFFGTILGHLITTKFDRLAGKSSAWWAARAKTRNDARKEKINILAHDDHEMLLEEFHLNRMSLLGIVLLSFGLTGPSISTAFFGHFGLWLAIIFEAGSALILLIGLVGIIWVLNQCDIVYEARRLRREVSKITIDQVLAKLQAERAKVGASEEIRTK